MQGKLCYYIEIVFKGMFGYRLFAKNWKLIAESTVAKIIFKSVNSAVRPRFT